MTTKNPNSENTDSNRNGRTSLQRTGRWGLYLVFAVVGVLLAGYLLLKLPAVQNKIRRLAVDTLEQNLAVQMELGRITGSLLRDLTLHDVRILQDGSPLMGADRITVHYRLLSLLRRSLHVRQLHIEALTLHLAQDADGNWILPRPATSTPREPDGDGRFRLRIERFSLDNARVTVSPARRPSISVRSLNLEAGLKLGTTSRVDVRRGSFRLQPMDLTVGDLRASARYRPRTQHLVLKELVLTTEKSRLTLQGGLQERSDGAQLDAELQLDTLSLEELDRLLPGLRLQAGTLRGMVRLQGPLARLQHRIQLAMNAQRFTAAGQTAIGEDGRWLLETAGSLQEIDPSRIPLAETPAVEGRLNADYTLRGQDLLNADRKIRLSLNLLPSRIETMEMPSGRLTAEFGREALTIENGRLDSSAGTIRFRGRLSDWNDRAGLETEFEVREMKPEQVPWPLKIAGTLNFDASLQAQRVGAKFADPASWKAHGRLTVHPSLLEEAPIQQARLKAAWNQGLLEVESLQLNSRAAAAALSGRLNRGTGDWQVQGDLTIPDLHGLQRIVERFSSLPDALAVPAGSLQASGSVRRKDRDLESSLTLQGELTASRPVWPADFAPTGKAKFRLRLDARHQGRSWRDSAAWNGRAELQLDSTSRLWNTGFHETSLQAEWNGRRLQIPKLEIDTDIAAASLRGTLVPRAGTGDVAGKIAIPQLAQLQPILRRLAPVPYRDLAPTGSLQVEGSGAVEDRRIVVAAHWIGSELFWQGTGAATVNLKTQWAGEPEDFRAAASGHIEALSTPGFRLPKLDLSAEATNRLFKLDLQAQAENDGRLQVSGEAQNWLEPRRRIRIDTLAIRHPPPPLDIGIAEIRNRGPLILSLSADTVQIESMPLAIDGAELSLTGSLRREGNQRLGLTLRQFPLQNLIERAGVRADIAGQLGLEAHVSGTAENPEISLQLDVFIDPQVDGLPDKVDARLVYRRNRLHLEGRGLRDGTPLFTTAGGVAVELRLLPFHFQSRPGSLDFALTSSNLQLAHLPLPRYDVLRPEGRIDLQLQATGDLAAPDFAGSAVLSDGSLRVPPAGLHYEEFSARLHLEPGRIHIEHLSLAGDHEGSLTAYGSVSMDGRQPAEFNLHVAGESLRVPYRDVATARVNADLQWFGTPANPVLTGRLAVVEGRVDLDRIAAGTPSEIEVIGRRGPENRRIVYEAGRESTGFFHFLEADIGVEILRDAWVKGQGLNAEISGNLELKKPSEEPFRLIGTLDVMRGTYKFQGKLFRITSGSIAFTGLPDPNPDFDIEAKTEIRRVDIRVGISGRADNLRLSLSSNPAMEQSDILSYLVFGRPSSELRWQQSAGVENAALGMTGNLAAAEFEGIFEEALNLDMLTFEFSDEDFYQSTMAFGKYVTQNIFVTYRHGIATRDYGQVEVDYQINRNFTLRTQLGDELASGVDLIWQLDF